MRSFFRRIKYTLTENLGDTCGGAAVVSHFVVGILTGAALYGYFPVLPQTVWILIGLLLSVPMFGMLFLAMKLISKGARKSVVYWLISFLGIYFTIQFATNESNEWHSFLLAFLFATGLVYATSAVTVFFRDMKEVVGILLQIGMWVTPIMWNFETMVQIPGWAITVLKLNPMYYIVSGYRNALINHIGFWEDMGLTVYFWVVTAVILFLGTTVFKRLRPHFADVL